MNTNTFPGTRVFFWATQNRGSPSYGVVLGASRLPDGTVMLDIREDSGRVIRLPAAGVSKVQ
ncbi:hypothetical protein C8J56DRAFT_225818 [Mycena floridula]|nr:hypothetical protein C8J56DRAFT_225818 [Mycena floridula]